MRRRWTLTLDRDVTHRGRDDALVAREDFHPQADADPSDLQKAAAEAGTVDAPRDRVGKEMTALEDDRRAPRDDDAIPRIARPDDERCQRLDVVQVDTNRIDSFVHEALERSDARHPRLDAWIQDGRRVVHAVDEIVPPFVSRRLTAAVDHRVR